MASFVALSSTLPTIDLDISRFMITPERGLEQERSHLLRATLWHTAAVVSSVALVIFAAGTFAAAATLAPICLPLVAVLTFMCRNLPSKLYHKIENKSDLKRLEALSFKWVPRFASSIPSDNDSLEEKLKILEISNAHIPENPTKRSELTTAIAFYVFSNNVEDQCRYVFPNNVENQCRKTPSPYDPYEKHRSFIEFIGQDESIETKEAEEATFHGELKATIGQLRCPDSKAAFGSLFKISAAAWLAFIQRPDVRSFKFEDLIADYKDAKTYDIPDLVKLVVELVPAPQLAARFVKGIDLQTSTG